MSHFGGSPEPVAVPVPGFVTTGIESAATTTLEPVAYPNRLNDVAIFGRTGSWERSWLLRPKYAGRYLFLLYPVESISAATVLTQTVNFPNFNSAPKSVEMRIPTDLRQYRDWYWRLVKTAELDIAEKEFELLDQVGLPGDGLLEGQSAVNSADFADREGSLTHLLYDVRPAMEGQIGFMEELERNTSRMVAWSCHQPYTSNANGAQVSPERAEIMQWYADSVTEFEPHRIWALGDTSYSDGTGALNFVAQVNNKAGWHNNWDLRKDLLSLYRLNYRFHWSFEPMQEVMRRFPHIAMWDDHEIRDGYGSDASDFIDENVVMKQIASQAAQEYLFSWNTPLRSESKRNLRSDNHLAYVDNPIASFVFDGRNSRNYGDDLPIPPDIPLLANFIAQGSIGLAAAGPIGLLFGALTAAVTSVPILAIEKRLIDIYRWNNPGEVISDQQLHDFERFCRHIAQQPNVKYLLLGNSVPFIFVNDFIESLASELELMASDLGQHARDDIRDSWNSPGNKRQLNRLIDIMRELHQKRPDIEMINLSGDIHISNAFSYQPEGFNKKLYQITSSGLTNPPTLSNEDVTNLLSVGGPLGFLESSEHFGDIHRLWHEGSFQNFLMVDANEDRISFDLKVFNRADTAAFGSRDQSLVI